MKRSGMPMQVHGALDAVRSQAFAHGAARAARHGVLLDRDDARVAGGQPADQSVVERLHEAHVDDRGVEPLADGERGVEQGAEAAGSQPERPSRRSSARPTGSAVISARSACPGPVPRG
jgi:hypothetical protein